MPRFNLKALEKSLQKSQNQTNLLTKEEMDNVNKKVGGGTSTQLGEGYHEDCEIHVELAPENAKFPGFVPIFVEFRKDGKSKKSWYAISDKEIRINNQMWAFDNLSKLYKAAFKLPHISALGVLEVNKSIIEDLGKDIPCLLEGVKVNVAIGFGASPHAVKVEDPNNPDNKVIKIKSKVKSKEGKWEEKIEKNSSGMADAVFDSFEAAKTFGEKRYGKKYKQFPDIERIIPSDIQEVDDNIIQLFEITYKAELAALNRNQNKVEEEEVEEVDIIEDEEEEAQEEDIFG